MFTYIFSREDDLYKAVMKICDNDLSAMSEAEQKQFIQEVVKPFTREEISLIHNFLAAIEDIKKYYSRGLN